MRANSEEANAPGPDPTTQRVIKFGGTSVTGGDRIDTIVEVVRDRLPSCRPVLVVSAFAQVTTLLERAAFSARDGEVSDAVTRLRGIHQDAVRDMTASSQEIGPIVDELLRDCEDRIRRIASESACSAQTLDEVLSYGERLSSVIITEGLVRRGIDAVRVDAADIVVTDANHGDARADLDATRFRVIGALPAFPVVPVVTGFLGATESGVRTTLGREGSDYSAAVLAWAIEAETVEIWTDVDGVMTADPRIVSDARPLRYLSYAELFELSSWGAKVVHPKTVRPLQERSIALSIRNTTAPSDPGTRVGLEEPTRGRSVPLGVAHLDVDALRSPGRGEPSTERTRHELSGLLGELDRINHPTAIVSVVGPLDGAGTPTLAALAEAVRREGIVVHGVSESPSGLAVSVAVDADQSDATVRVLHEAVFAPVPETSHA